MANQIATIDSFRQELGLPAVQKQLNAVLPKHISPEKFCRTVLGAVQSNPDILEADRPSVFLSCQKAAQDGLLLDNREAALVVFNTKEGNSWVKKAQYMPMVGGILKKLRNSGQISTITAQVVKKNDAFKYNPAMDEVPNHNPDWFGQRGEMIGVYAVAKLKDGGVIVDIMSMEDLEKIRRVSKTGDKDGKPAGIWAKWPEEMAKKSVIRRIAKLLPSSADVDMIFENDNEGYDFEQSPPQPSQPEKPKGKTRAESIVMEGEIINKQTGEINPDEPPPMTDDDII